MATYPAPNKSDLDHISRPDLKIENISEKVENFGKDVGANADSSMRQ
jgi:hypothetical protein